MVMKKLVVASLALIAAVLFAQNANAVPSGTKVLQESASTTFDTVLHGFAVVDYEVYKYTSGSYAGEYLYTYQIFNDSASAIRFNFFSVGILDGANAKDPGYDSIGVVDPTVWGITGSPAQSADALFFGTIKSGEDSALLWFISETTYTLGKGTLFGTYSEDPVYATGDLSTPVPDLPEPATVVLLGLGGLVTLVQRKSSLFSRANHRDDFQN